MRPEKSLTDNQVSFKQYWPLSYATGTISTSSNSYTSRPIASSDLTEKGHRSSAFSVITI